MQRYQEVDSSSGGQDSTANEPEDFFTGRGGVLGHVPGRVLNTTRVMERVFDVDGERILVKFQRETGQIFCKTVEFLPPKATPEDEGEPELTADDIKVFLVDPREERPSQTELELVYDEQIHRQESALDAVHRIEREMDALLETRMKELSSNEMDVWLYDVKRNPQVKRGRMELERAAKAREESVMDLEIDFIAPFLERSKGQGMDGTAMSAKQVQEVNKFKQIKYEPKIT